MTQRYSALYRFHWKPMVAFPQRRQELAEWIDGNIDPRGILDQDDVLGVAIADQNLRITVSRTGFDISMANRDLTIAPLEHLLRGIHEVVAPSGVHAAQASLVIGSELTGSYSDLAERFARQRTGISSQAVRPVDAAVLADLELDSAQLQIEYGVVSADEIAFRLSSPSAGRTLNSRPEYIARRTESFPHISLYCDYIWRATDHQLGPGDTSAEGFWSFIRSQIDYIDSECATITQTLSSFFTPGSGSSEFNRGA